MSQRQSLCAALDGHYQLHFAGRPRATRDLAMLDALLAELVRAGGGEAGAASRLRRWQHERDEVAAVQDALGPRGVGAMRACERLALPALRVRRLARTHQPSLCAPAELAALQADVATALSELGQLPADVATSSLVAPVVERTFTELQQAAAALAAWQAAPFPHGWARADGGSSFVAARAPTDEWAATGAEKSRTVMGAARAQRLFALFAACVEGRSQLVVRPELLDVWADALDQARQWLEAAPPADLEIAVHRANVEGLLQQAAHWRLQAQRAREQRQQCEAKEVLHALLEEADAILEAAQTPGMQSSGHVAPSVSGQTEQATMLAWRMDEVCRQLDAIPSVFGLGGDERAVWGLFDCVHFLDEQVSVGPARTAAR